MSITWRSVALGMMFCLSAAFLAAQSENISIRPKNNSPLSRFGLGDMLDQYLAASAGMGGLSAAYNEPFHINLLNPASLPHLQSTAFEVGMYSKYASLKDGQSSDDIWSGNLSYIALGFPLKNPVNRTLNRETSPWDFGMSLSLTPYTLVGYDIEVQQFDEDGFDVATNYLKGNGGTYRLGWGNAVKYKGFSFGASASYLFGKLTNSRRVGFDSLSFSYNTEFLDEFSVNGFQFNFGVQYTAQFKKTNDKGVRENANKRLTIGIYGNPTTNFNTNSSRYFNRYLSEAIRDTILYEAGVEGNGQLPVSYTAGVMYESGGNFRIGAEYSQTKWSKYTNDAKSEEMADTYRAAAGLEWIPDPISYNKYFNRVRYRLGTFYETDPRLINDEQVTKYGLTFGLGFPIIMPRQQISFVNTSLELGKFGVDAETLSETYVKLTVGFTLNDNSWFFKRKFN